MDEFTGGEGEVPTLAGTNGWMLPGLNVIAALPGDVMERKKDDALKLSRDEFTRGGEAGGWREVGLAFLAGTNAAAMASMSSPPCSSRSALWRGKRMTVSE